MTGDEQHLTRARTGAITGAVVAIMLVVFSLFVLFWPDGNDDSLVTSPVARELADPSIVPTPTPLPSPTPTPTPRAGPPVAAGTSWYNAPAAAREWKPPVIRGPAVAELIIVNEVTDSPGQTIEYADNAAGRRWVASGEAVAAQIRDGEVLVVQNTPSGWPDPEIQCDGGNPFVSGSRVLLTTAAGQRVTCVFRNTPTSDSLGVRATTVTCRGIEGDLRGTEGPFNLRFLLSQGGASTSTPTLQADDLVVAVAEPGPFVIDLGETTGLSGQFQMGYLVRDQLGSQVGSVDEGLVNFDDYPCAQVALRLQPASVLGLPARTTDWSQAARLTPSGPAPSLERSIEYRSEVEGGAGEVLLFADSTADEIVPIGPSMFITRTTSQDDVRIVMRMPSGWPEPEMSCDRGFVRTSGLQLDIDMRAVPVDEFPFVDVRCVFRSVPDEDSLRVTDLSLDCEGVQGTMHGLDGPFFVTIDLEPDDRLTSAVTLGTFRIEEPGAFVAPTARFETQPEPGRYSVDVTIWDSSDSQLQMIDTAVVTMPESAACS